MSRSRLHHRADALRATRNTIRDLALADTVAVADLGVIGKVSQADRLGRRTDVEEKRQAILWEHHPAIEGLCEK
jgi:hypothetical protein